MSTATTAPPRITPENALLHRNKLPKAKPSGKSKLKKKKNSTSSNLPEISVEDTAAGLVTSDDELAQELQDGEVAKDLDARLSSDATSASDARLSASLSDDFDGRLSVGSASSQQEGAEGLKSDALRERRSSRHSIGDRVKEAFGLGDHTSHSGENAEEGQDSSGQQKKTRKQARKEKKQSAFDKLREHVKAEMAKGGPDEREVERKKLEKTFDGMGVHMVEINPDGHCMYNAIADQLRYLRVADLENHITLRKMAADRLRSNPDKYLPFLPARDGSDDMMTLEGFSSYCEEVESSTLWGGQVELMALSEAYSRPIHVVQAETATPLEFGEEFGVGGKVPITVSYHRKMYGLGEHYNSLRKKV